MNKKIVVVILSIVTVQLNAFWGAAYFAMQGPSIPRVMREGQLFKKSQTIKPHQCIESDNKAVVDVEVHEKHFNLLAKRPGSAHVRIFSDNEKKKSTNRYKKKAKETKKEKAKHLVVVAYNHLSEIPTTAHVGDKIYVVSHRKKSMSPVTCDDKKLVTLKRELISDEYYYMIKCKKPGKVTFCQDGQTVTLKIEEQEQEQE